MEVWDEAVEAVEGVLGHGEAPAKLSLPLAAWAVAVAGDGMALATGSRSLDVLGELAIGAGLIGSAGALATGFAEGRRGEITTEDYPTAVAAHAVGASAVMGLFAASLALRITSSSRGERPTALARGLSILGGSLALANAVLIARLKAEGHPRGRRRLDPDSPLGLA